MLKATSKGTLIAPFFLLSILGLSLSITAHMSTFCGFDPLGTLPYIWLLHIGIFVIWLPAILCTKRRTQHLPKSEQWRAALSEAPKWMRALQKPIFAYAIFNFFFTIFYLQRGHSPAIRNGQFVLQNHSKIIRTITEAEYHRYQAYEVRTFSGHWILFYFMGAMMLYPKKSEQSSNLSEVGHVR